MRNKILFLLAALALGAILAACGPSTLTVQTQPTQRTITVTGTGMITLTPDIAYIYIGVQTQEATASQALAENNAKTQAVIASIKSFGVADKDIKTTDFSVSPQQQYDSSGKITATTFMVQNTVYVTIRDLSKLGSLLDSVVQSGANTINSISFDVADKTQALSQARQSAVATARAQADELTSATGVKLGPVQTITYEDSTPPVPVAFAPRLASADQAVPVSAGSMQITTTVTIVYAIQ
jgi:uncharacterized protein YggE